MPKIILASTSPRRRELLTAMGLTFEVVASDFEEHLDHTRPASEVAAQLAHGKALAVAKLHPDAIVIGGDTIPHLNGHQLEKAVDYQDAERMLRMLSGHEHELTSGLAIIWLAKGVDFSTSDTTCVQFKPLDEDAIQDYLATGDYKDKAGAYGLQSGAHTLVASIRGEYDTVIGLPTKQLSTELAKLGIDTKPVVLQPPVPQQ